MFAECDVGTGIGDLRFLISPGDRVHVIPNRFPDRRTIPAFVNYSANLDRSPVLGAIVSIWPPLLPLLLKRRLFDSKGKDSHRIFLEPEAGATSRHYPSSISTRSSVRVPNGPCTMRGLGERLPVTAGLNTVEYDYYDPRPGLVTFENRRRSSKPLLCRSDQAGTTGCTRPRLSGCPTPASMQRQRQGGSAGCRGAMKLYRHHAGRSDDKGVSEPIVCCTSR